MKARPRASLVLALLAVVASIVAPGPAQGFRFAPRRLDVAAKVSVTWNEQGNQIEFSTDRKLSPPDQLQLNPNQRCSVSLHEDSIIFIANGATPILLGPSWEPDAPPGSAEPLSRNLFPEPFRPGGEVFCRMRQLSNSYCYIVLAFPPVKPTVGSTTPYPIDYAAIQSAVQIVKRGHLKINRTNLSHLRLCGVVIKPNVDLPIDEMPTLLTDDSGRGESEDMPDYDPDEEALYCAML